MNPQIIWSHMLLAIHDLPANEALQFLQEIGNNMNRRMQILQERIQVSMVEVVDTAEETVDNVVSDEQPTNEATE